MVAWRFTPARTPVRFAETQDPLLVIADSLEPEMAKAFLSAVKTLRASGGRTVKSYAWAKFEASLTEALVDVVLKGMKEHGVTVALKEPDSEVVGGFDLVNEESLNHIRREAADHIVGITEQTREAIREYIEDAVENGVSPSQLAKRIKGLIGLNPGQVHSLARYEAGLVRSGVAPARIARMVDKFADRLLRYRATVIARTEVLNALAAGQQILWEQRLAEGLLPKTARKVWVTTPDDRLCLKICAPMDGQHQKIEDDFLTGDGRRVRHPGAHAQCRCSFSLQFQKGAA